MASTVREPNLSKLYGPNRSIWPAAEPAKVLDAAFHAKNARRHELIHRRLETGISSEEVAELERLQEEVGAAIDAVYPLPPPPTVSGD